MYFSRRVSKNTQELSPICRQVRRDIITMTANAGSGHPGGSLSAVELMTSVFFNHMRVDPQNPHDPNRDRFVLSKGHAAPCYYAVLAAKGFISRDEYANFRQLHSILQNGWGADFGDPVNFLGQEVLSDDNAYYAQTTSWIAAVEADPKDYQKELLADYQEFTDLVTEAKAIVTDTDARYAAFAKAEASMLNNALCIPCLYEVLWCLTHVNEYTKINAMYGPCNYKAVNWETRQGDGYTTEEYEAFSAAFDAATKA